MVATIALLSLLFQSPAELRDPATGLSLRLVNGWTADPARTGGDHETAIVLHDPKSESNFAVFYFHPVTSTTEESLRAAVPAIVSSRTRTFGDFHLRQGSIESRSVAGHQGISFVGDYSDKGKLMAEYVVELGDEKTGVIFFARMHVESLETFRPRFDALIETLRMRAPGTALQSTNRTVNIDVIAVDKNGQTVFDLTGNDFSIADNGITRPVALFARDRVDAGSKLPPPLPILPSDTFSNKSSLRSAASTVLLLDALNTPVDQLAGAKLKVISYLRMLDASNPVAIYFLGNELTLIHDFPRNSLALIDAIDRLNEVVAERATGERAAATEMALRAIKARLAYIPGRKNLVWIAGSFLSGSAGFDDVSVYPVSTLRFETGSDPASRPAAEPVRELAEKLAADTGGRAFYGVNNLVASLQSVIRDSQASYTVSFSLPPASLDEKQHTLKVTVRRPEVTLRYRQKYFASPNLERPSLEDALQSGASIPSIGFEVKMQAIGGALKAHLRVDPHGLTFTERGGKWGASLLVIAGSADKKTPAIPVHMSLNAEQYAGVQKDGFELVQDMPEGVSECVFAIQDTASGQIGTLRFTR